ncbi:MAG: FAD-dependent oxidoreductase [Gordonia sp. (in: high G+C Gram-positive bacteria)]
MLNGEVSFWSATLGADARHDPLDGDATVDIAIVGGGLTGLWAAYYLSRAVPDAQILVIESKFCGFGASGRNGGWLSAEVPGNRRRYGEIAQRAGRDPVAANRALTAALEGSVAEVAQRLDDEGIDCDAEHSGVITVARCAAQQARLRAEVAEAEHLGSTAVQWLTADELAARISVDSAVAGSFSPHCIRVQPAALTRGVADAVVRHGVRIVENTTATQIGERRVITDRGRVDATHVLVCVEGFTPRLPGAKRSLLPMNSSMVVTDPLPEHIWDEIGWGGAELLGETAHAYTYAQRTADGRIAMGGRGVPYRFGSGIDDDGVTQERTARAITRALRTLFPAARDVPIAQAWCGVLGVHRDWCASIGYDGATGIGHANGYVGSGLTMTNLAGRTLCDLVTGKTSELTELPWVAHATPRWEFEPLRYLGVSTMYAAYRGADRLELRSSSSRTNVLARVADRVSGRA